MRCSTTWRDRCRAGTPRSWRSKQAFLDAGALGAVMSGSGPTVVALARQMGHADRLAEAVPGSFVVSGPPAG